MAHGNFGNKNRRNKWKQGDPVTKTMFDRAIKQIAFWEGMKIDKNNLPPGYTVKDFVKQSTENHRIVKEYYNQKNN